MEVIDFLGQGLKFPISVKKARISTSAGYDSIKDSIILILGTGIGERVMRPDFGCRLSEMVFASNDVGTATLIHKYIEEALMIWEPRIKVDNISSKVNQDTSVMEITIEYTVKSSNSKENLVYPFYLESVGK